MAKLTGGQAAVEALKAEKVGHVFGLIGSATMEMFDALYDAKDIRLIGVHDERTGTHMADGYARMSGRAGVVLAGQNGPGATNLVTGLGQAKAAYSPVVSIAGSLAASHVYRDAFQEVDQQALFTPITKKTWTATSADRLPEMVREAFRVAMTPRRGPVQLNLPRDVLSAQADFDSIQTPETYRSQSNPAAPAEAIEQAAKLLAGASRPVIIAGGGIKNTGGHAQALALAEALNAPIVTSPGHGDAIPFGHPLNAGQMGPRGNIVASRLVREADVILALGTRIGFNSTLYSYDNINRDAAIIQVELEPKAIGRYFPVALGIWADAPTAAKQLSEALGKIKDRATADTWTEAYKSERAAYLAKRDADAQLDAMPIHPSGLFRTLHDVLPRDAAVTVSDTGGAEMADKTYPATSAQRGTGDWNPMWDTLAEMDPDYLETFLAFRAVPQTKGPLEQKYKELIFIAINVATTHLWPSGVRRHIQNALKAGATKEEILEVMQLTSIMGIHSMALGLPVLMEEVARHDKN